MTTGFVLILPFLERSDLYDAYNTRVGAPPSSVIPNEHDEHAHMYQHGYHGPVWANVVNSTVITREIATFFCPSNRSEGLVFHAHHGGGHMQGIVILPAATDYGFCHGAIAALCGDPSSISMPAHLDGVFGINSRTRVTDIKDGAGQTVLMGEIAGGEGFVGTYDFDTDRPPDSTALDGRSGSPFPRPWGVDQPWGMTAIRSDQEGPEHGGLHRGSIFISAFQHVGMDLKIDGDPATELPARMNPRLVRQARVLRLPSGKMPANVAGPNPKCVEIDDRLSEARSAHHGICYFLFADGSVRGLSETLDLRVYGAVFTKAGGETNAGDL